MVSRTLAKLADGGPGGLDRDGRPAVPGRTGRMGRKYLLFGGLRRQGVLPLEIRKRSRGIVFRVSSTEPEPSTLPGRKPGDADRQLGGRRYSQGVPDGCRQSAPECGGYPLSVGYRFARSGGVLVAGEAPAREAELRGRAMQGEPLGEGHLQRLYRLLRGVLVGSAGKSDYKVWADALRIPIAEDREEDEWQRSAQAIYQDVEAVRVGRFGGLFASRSPPQLRDNLDQKRCADADGDGRRAVAQPAYGGTIHAISEAGGLFEVLAGSGDYEIIVI